MLTESRKEHAQTVMSCITCNSPVLLEGPAAVGKTSLILALAAQQHPPVTLERVNNTDTTTVQDYLGSYLPVGKKFEFNPGALYRAMENGAWFLADEFNLAEPSVLNVLFPLLEGQGEIRVPGTSRVVVAHPRFRFFATQNDARNYAGRHKLPTSLRSRFMEAQIGEFMAEELAEIILKRNEDSAGGFAVAGDARPLSEDNARKIAKVYGGLRKARFAITMREIIKWIRRSRSFPRAPNLLPLAGLSLLATREIEDAGPAGAKRREVLRVFSDCFSLDASTTGAQAGRASVKPVTTPVPGVEFKLGGLSVVTAGARLDRCSPWKHGGEPPQCFMRALVRVAFAVHNHEPVLLVGPVYVPLSPGACASMQGHSKC